MMTRRQLACVVLLLVTAMTLTTLLATFSSRKAVLRAEGADLASTQSVVVEASLAELRSRADRFRSGTHVFTTIDDGTMAVVVLTGRWNDIPLHAGRRLLGETDEALAGAQRGDVGDVVRVAGRDRTIVGRLGLRPESPLADTMVIADSSVFPDRRERLRLDGPSVAERYRAAFPGRTAEVVDRSTNRRTNVDVVTPVLIAAGAVLVVLVTSTAAWLSVRADERAARIRYRAGRSRAALLGATAVRAAGAAGVGAAGAVALGTTVSTIRRIEPSTVPLVAGVAAVFVVLVASGAAVRSRRWN
jgi:hypothetical protein